MQILESLATRGRADDAELVQDLMDSFFRILSTCGVPAQQLMHAALNSSQSAICLTTPHERSDPLQHHLACTDVVFQWRRLAGFTDDDGLPMPLPVKGLASSFEELAAISAPDSSPDEILEYLCALGAVRFLPDGRVQLASESVLACTGRLDGTIAPRTVLAHIRGFISSVEFNLLAKQDNASGRFERACYAFVPLDVVPILLRLVEARGQIFVDSIDEWLSRHRRHPASGETLQVGAGAYVFVHDAK